MIDKIKAWVKAHTILVLLVPGDAYVLGSFFWSVTTGASIGIQLAFGIIGVVIVILKTGLAGDLTRIGFTLWLVASLLNVYAAVCFFTSHASSATDIPDTVEIQRAQADVESYKVDVATTERERTDALAANRLSAIRDVIKPQYEKDQANLVDAQNKLDALVREALLQPPNAEVVFARPVQLAKKGTYSAWAILIFSLCVSFFVEGVTFYNMRKGKKRPGKATKNGYPLSEKGTLLIPMYAAKMLGISVQEATARFVEEKERGYK